MVLSARILNDVNGVNSFDYCNQAEWVAGDTVTLFFQLVDASKDRMEKGFVPAGRRFVPAAGATLSVTLTNIDDAKVVTRNAAQAYSTLDGSIWSVSILSTDTISGTCDLVLSLNEGGRITRGRLVAAAAISGSGTL